MGLKKSFKDTWPEASARAIKFMGAIITALTVWRLVNLSIKGPRVQKGSHVRIRRLAGAHTPHPTVARARWGLPSRDPLPLSLFF